jgi:hypothetical protein
MYPLFIEIDTGMYFINFLIIFLCLLMSLSLLVDTNLGNILPLYFMAMRYDETRGSRKLTYPWHLHAA